MIENIHGVPGYPLTKQNFSSSKTVVCNIYTYTLTHTHTHTHIYIYIVVTISLLLRTPLSILGSFLITQI